MEDKPLAWLGTSLSDVRAFPDEARRATGYQLRRVQQGLMPTDWKPISSVGKGVLEIRLHGPVGHRILYIAKFSEAIYVLHAFEKKSQKTRMADLATARKRLKDLEDWRRMEKET
jgi:phage-related protein